METEKFLGLMFFLCLWLEIATCSGRLQIKALNYTNLHGKDAKGFCFDDDNAQCAPNACDPYFRVCAGPGHTPGPPCPYADVTTAVFENMNQIDFDQSKGSYVWEISFQSWTGDVKIEVDIFDDDSKEDLVNDVIGVLTSTVTIGPSSGQSRVVTRLAGKDVDLFISLSVTCDPDYHGQDCATFCVPTNDASGHYACGFNGRKICLVGWIGANCDVVDPCSSRPCQNNGTCSVLNGVMACSCVSGTSGRLCEILPTTQSHRTSPTSKFTTTSASKSAGYTPSSTVNIVGAGRTLSTVPSRPPQTTQAVSASSSSIQTTQGNTSGLTLGNTTGFHTYTSSTPSATPTTTLTLKQSTGTNTTSLTTTATTTTTAATRTTITRTTTIPTTKSADVNITTAWLKSSLFTRSTSPRQQTSGDSGSGSSGTTAGVVGGVGVTALGSIAGLLGYRKYSRKRKREVVPADAEERGADDEVVPARDTSIVGSGSNSNNLTDW